MKLAEYLTKHRPRRRLATQQMAALSWFRKSPRTRKELAQDLGISENAAKSLIFRMKGKGLVQRSAFIGDEIIWTLKGGKI
jgi:DNA-binding MarR family transcriptional regulator